MRSTLLVLLALVFGPAVAAPITIQLEAPAYAGKEVLLMRQLDLFTPRTALLARALLDAQGKATLTAEVDGTVKGTLVITGVHGELWLRAGTYQVQMPAPAPGSPRSVNGTTQVDLVFTGLDHLDVNALVSDLNERLDAFVSEDLATDRQAGMQAVDIVRRGEGQMTPDTVKRPKTLFITPSWSTGRVDSFATKLRRFYAEVQDPWFQADLEYGIAGLYLGPRENDRTLFERYLKGRPLHEDVPEYARFAASFFEDHLMRFPFHSDEDHLTRFINGGASDSLLLLLAKHDFLRDEPQLCELVMLLELYEQYPAKTFDRNGIRTVLQDRATRSPYAEHRTLATNILWDLTAMHPGAEMPSLTLQNVKGEAVVLDSLLQGPVCVVLTASWCAYCEQELAALEALYKDYGTVVHFIGIDLDPTVDDLRAYLKAHPGRNWTWLHAGDDPLVMDALRLRSIPTFLLLNGRTLAQSPAPPPSNGLPAVLYRIKAEAIEQQKIKPDAVDQRPRRR